MEGLNTKKAWLFLAPMLALMAVFTFYPLVHTVILSFLNDYNGMDAAGGERFNFGINNYIKLFNGSATAKKFGNALMITSILVIFTVPLSLIIALLIAVALNAIKPLKKLFQTLYFLPYVTNTLAVGAVFAVMFQYPGQGTAGVTGIMNSILQLFGIPAVNWVGPGSELWANIVVMVIYIVWNALPFKILIFMGALNSLNTQYYDAAKVDGASKFRIFRNVK
jgi:multiple sugar transport system permease protein